MLIVQEVKYRRRGHVFSCRRGIHCFCSPPCHDRPAGYEDKLVPYCESTVFYANGSATLPESNRPWLVRSDNDALAESYVVRDCMILVALCIDASTSLFPMQLHARVCGSKITYKHLSTLLKHCRKPYDVEPNIFNYISPSYFNRARHMKHHCQFLLAILPLICESMGVTDIAKSIALYTMRAFWCAVITLLESTCASPDRTLYYAWCNQTV